jgi:hypothetical protein
LLRALPLNQAQQLVDLLIQVTQLSEDGIAVPTLVLDTLCLLRRGGLFWHRSSIQPDVPKHLT